MMNNQFNLREMNVEQLKAMANQNNAEAIMELSRRYLLGEDLECDKAKSFELLTQSAELGYAPAQVTLGAEYKFQLKNYKEAVKWFKRAADKGYAPAQYFLAICYLQGKGVEQDYNEAVALLNKSAEQDNYLACCELAMCYEEGKGVEKDPVEAEKWHNKIEELKIKLGYKD